MMRNSGGNILDHVGSQSHANTSVVNRSFQARAAEPAQPGRRRIGPLGGQDATRSEQPWGQSDRHDVLFLASDQLVDFGNETIGELLDFVMRAALVVF